MELKKLSTACNLSNQANVHTSNEVKLTQLNFVVFLGLKNFGPYGQKSCAPLSVTINKSGELQIFASDGCSINNDNIKIYAERKVTDSEHNI